MPLPPPLRQTASAGPVRLHGRLWRRETDGGRVRRADFQQHAFQPARTRLLLAPVKQHATQALAMQVLVHGDHKQMRHVGREHQNAETRHLAFAAQHPGAIPGGQRIREIAARRPR
ncbi:hypothetical protein G6F59_017472 [Rhizopus arrhizus]|nr:hypothetical protein G6F59_017472 [Rhizopus arrhizus]